MIRFGSRGSELALAQTRLVAEDLKRRSGEAYSIEVIETRGDRNVDQPLPEVGGKGLFTAELEDAMRVGRIDAAVHSLKDLPVEEPTDLVIGATPQRAAAHDMLVYDPDRKDSEGGTLPIVDGSVVGTSSPRRRAAVLALRPYLRVSDIRGNVPTRIAKVAKGEYGGTLLAAAGLERLGEPANGLGVLPLPTGTFTPAPGQGALAVQCRTDDSKVRPLLAQLHDETTGASTGAERRVLERLGGGCSMPLGVLVTPGAEGYRMQATLYSGLSSPGPVAHRFPVEFEGADPAALAERAVAELRPLIGEPLNGLSIRLVRPGGEGGRLGAGLAVAGCVVQTVALTETLPLGVDGHGIELLAASSVVAFTSARAVDRYFELAAMYQIETAGRRFYGGGPATSRAVRERGLECLVPEQSGGAFLARFILDREGGSNTVLFPCAVGRRPDLEEVLAEGGCSVTALPVYETRPIPGVQLPEDSVSYTVFTSPSAVQAFWNGGHRLEGRTLAIGSTTAAAMTDLGMKPAGVPEQPTAQALVQQISELEGTP